MNWLLSLFTGPVLSAITGPFLEAYKAKLAATNSEDKLAVDLAVKEIEAEIEARRAAKEIIIAEQGRWWTAIWRPLLAAPVVIFLWKVIVWDTVLGLGSTAPLAGDVATWSGMIVTAYVGGRTIEKVAQVFRRR